ncbi:hypothetical protein LF887_06180 [Chryseobacterium sp. MEBOG06]|uniref:hypothetical protein n=1 Tax=Chryseobacterium sp. MEBOG06 TaxID=2879938 RepID=UPI001F408580|nr:hypothetical protein [Chryseobacterium sp. MEBOG06]UKB85211.1 hypothetical protein LF887_06180 [Chryseobacterium sp. MEBOG06]
MNLRRIGYIFLAALALTSIILVIEVNIHHDNINFTKAELNEIILWSFIRGLVISLAVNIANHYHSLQKSKNN